MRIRLLAVAALAAPAALVALAPAPAASAAVAYTWVGSSVDPSADNHSWSDPRNWQPTGVPGDGDSVSISAPNPTHCVAHVDGVPAVTLADFSLVDNRCGSNVHGGPITVTGTLTWDGGSLDAPTTIAAGSHGTILGTSQKQNGLVRNLDVAGTLALDGVTGKAALLISNPSVLHVLPGGTLRSTGTNTVTFLSCCVNPARVTNDGTLAVDGGTLEVDAVALDQDGALVTSGGGRLLSTGAPVTAGDGATYAGDGGWTIHEHSHAVFTGTQDLGADFHLELGELTDQSDSTLGGTTMLAGAGTFDWDGGTIEASLATGPDVTVRASGAHVNNGRRILKGSDPTVTPPAPASLTVHGTLVVDDGAAIGTSDRAVLTVAADGTASLAPGTELVSGACCVAPDTIVNRGRLVLPAGTDPVLLEGVYYRQTSGGRLDLTFASTASGRLLVHGTARLAGRLVVHDAAGYRPARHAKRTAVTGDPVKGAFGCTTTAGTGSTGPGAGHWQPKLVGGDVVVTWTAGKQTSC